MKRGASSSSSGAVSSDAFEKHLASCLRTTSVSAYKQTWELNKNPVQLLHDFSIAKRVGPLPLIDFGGDLDVGAPVVVDTHLFKLRRTVDMRTWEEKLNVHMVAAIRKWAGIVLSFPLAFDVGRKYFTNHNLVPGGIHEMLKHVSLGRVLVHCTTGLTQCCDSSNGARSEATRPSLWTRKCVMNLD